MPTAEQPAAGDEITASDAAGTLDDLDRIRGRTHRAATASLTRIPLSAWGIAWIVGFVLLDLQPWSLAVPIGLALAAAAALTTWFARSREVRSGREVRVGLGWLVVMVCSPVLLVVISPVGRTTEVIFLGCLWGVALLLLAVATLDVALGIVGGLIVVAAGCCHVLLHEHQLLVFGVVGGAAMLVLGLARIWRSR